MTIAFCGAFFVAITLMLFSAWRVSRYVYFAILAFFAAGLILAELRSGLLTVDLLAVVFDVLIFGCVFYYVTVQQLMGRKASEITSRDEFRETMEGKGTFDVLAKFVYYLPIPLLAGIVLLGGIGAYLS